MPTIAAAAAAACRAGRTPLDAASGGGGGAEDGAGGGEEAPVHTGAGGGARAARGRGPSWCERARLRAFLVTRGRRATGAAVDAALALDGAFAGLLFPLIAPAIGVECVPARARAATHEPLSLLVSAR